MFTFQNLISTLQPSIFTWSYFSDFKKIKNNSFKIKIQLNILNSLLWEKTIEDKFMNIIKEYPKTREVLPILIATRKTKFKEFPILLDKNDIITEQQGFLFDSKQVLDKKWEEQILHFFRETWLKNIFENKYISNLEDYVFGVETWLDTNARKNRTGTLMENLVEGFIKEFCEKNIEYEYKDQVTVKYIEETWWIEVKSDKTNRRFDFVIYDWNKNKIYLIEVNYYWWWGSKLKSVAGEFSSLYRFLNKQDIELIWITDGQGWNTTKKSLEEAYNATNWNIYNLEMLKEWILNKLFL